MKIIVDKMPEEPSQCLLSYPDAEGLKWYCSLKVNRLCKNTEDCYALSENLVGSYATELDSEMDELQDITLAKHKEDRERYLKNCVNNSFI